ncbi:hypothetical protein JZ751_025834 [Albula glossodonta]|uniref:Uncharacterized protein n=1 Tax=Albula glossodonta TaxID=121402 RepID=A0A8T2NGK5_9TELE|nr:hypothetical protein JZ751_025834 [Albula glossodonta]
MCRFRGFVKSLSPHCWSSERTRNLPRGDRLSETVPYTVLAASAQKGGKVTTITTWFISLQQPCPYPPR